MIENPLVIQLAVFAGVTALLSWLFLLLSRREAHLQARLNELNESEPTILNLGATATSERSVVASLWGQLQRVAPQLLWSSESRQNEQRLRCVRAGLYSRSSCSIFAAIKLLLTLLTGVVIVVAIGLVLTSRNNLCVIVGPACALALTLPGFWLRWRTARRQAVLQRSLPDFLDVIVICLEGGMSFESALRKTSEELREAHPLLARELEIVQREIGLGRSVEDALHNLAERTGLKVIKLLATNVQQARRLGIRMADSLRTHADILRTQREQRAEERAQKAAVKILFPTLLFIFPTIFVVVAGPAVFEIKDMFAEPPPVTQQEAVGP